jgi:hypothetical protein
VSLNPSLISDNPQQPSAVAETYIPDGLIAGDLKLVTEGMALITGGVNLSRGTVLGKLLDGTASASTGKTFATGQVTIAELPASGDTLTIGGTAITFLTPPGSWQDEPPAGNNVYIGTTTLQTAQNLVAFLNGSADSNLIKFGYSLHSTADETVVVTAKVIGTGGNSLTLATSDATAFALSGATLSGGTANTGNATVGSISNGVATKPGNYTAVCLTAITAQVYDPNGAELGVATFGAAFASPQINFTITAGGTPCIAGDTFNIAAAAGSGSYKLAVASATDGSQYPVAILADYAAAAAGDVNSGVYLMGEFNVNWITLDPSIPVAAAKSALRLLGIFLKGAVSADDPAGE